MGGNMANGFVTVPRLEADLFGDEQETIQTHRGAWLWLFDKAAWGDRVERFGRFTVRLRRGEIAASYRFLARAWNWSHGRVQRWLQLLADRGKLQLRVEAGVVVIALDGYARRESNPESQKPKQREVEMPVDDQQSSRRRIQEQQTELEKKEGALGRSAPVSDDDRAYVAERVAEATQTLTGKRPAPIGDQAAYAAAAKAERRKNWLRSLSEWIGQKFDGAARMAAWEALAQAEQAGTRAATPPLLRKQIDRLDKLYRAEMERIEAAAKRAKEARRRETVGAANALYR
jgi:hypothetical protein